MTKTKTLKLAFMLVWSVLLTGLTIFLGAAPLKAFRTLAGKPVYWVSVFALVGISVVLNLWVPAIAFAALALMVGIYSDLEETEHSVVYCSLWALLITNLLLAGAFAVWVSRIGTIWYSQLLTVMEQALPQALVHSGVKLDMEGLLAQAPSAVIAVGVIALFVMLVMENRLRTALGLVRRDRKELFAFRLPDSFIWVFAASMLGAFLKYDTRWLQIVSINVFNVVVVAYFVQGMAVIFSYYRTFRVGMFWRMLITTVLVLQLFLFVSLVGLTDYWLNFRDRLAKKTTGNEQKMYE